MLKVLVASSKGGAGKTTIATNLAAHYAVDGRNTVLVDADRQGSSQRWAEKRAEMPNAVLGLPCLRRDWAKHVPADAEPVEELRTKHGLQLAERVTRGRLRARDLVSRGPRRAAARHRREHLQLAQRELQSLIDFLIHCNRNYAAHESVRCLA